MGKNKWGSSLKKDIPKLFKVGFKLWQLVRAVMLIFSGLVLSGTALADILMTKGNFVTLPEGHIELRFEFDSAPPAPQAYMLNKPKRLVLDLWGVESDLERQYLDVQTGIVDIVNFGQSSGRLRISVSLNHAAAYETRIENNALFITLAQKNLNSKALNLGEASRQATIERSHSPAPTRILGMDFEREEGAVGRVTLNLSDASPGVDIFEEGNNVVVNLNGALLPPILERRVDVQDFATPIMFIDAMANGNNTSILIKPSAEPYDYLAYQTDNQLIIDFKPVSSIEEEKKQRELFPFTGEPIDLDFQNIELRSVLQIIAEVAELNLVVSDKVAGNITLRLKNVPWDQALDIILKANGLDHRTEGNILMVAPTEEIMERERIELTSSQTIKELTPLRTQFIQVEYRKASDMKTIVEEAKLISERGFIMSDDETNVLMVRETQTAIDEIRNTLRQFDIEVEQVLIEARLVTARSVVTEDLGVKWGLGYNDVDNGKGWILDNQIGNINFANTEIRTSPNLMVDLGASALNPGSIALGYKSGTSSLLALELTALESDGKAEVIAQPKVLTTNGKTALIESGSEVPYQSVVDDKVSIEFKDVLLSLNVTPRINPGDRIAMDLHITQDTIGEVLLSGNVAIDRTGLQTTVVVPDGQTIVLGGVFKNESNSSVSKVPLLGDVPVMGSLFRNTENNVDKTELLIFITPKLVRNSLSAR